MTVERRATLDFCSGRLDPSMYDRLSDEVIKLAYTTQWNALSREEELRKERIQNKRYQETTDGPMSTRDAAKRLEGML